MEAVLAGQIRTEPRLFLIAAIASVGGPGQAMVAPDIGIVARVVLAVIGLFAWWYIFRCLSGALGSRVLRRSESAPTLVPWLAFTGAFYAHGLLLGRAWRDCHIGEAGLVLLHVMVSAVLAGTAGVGAWAALLRATEGRRPVVPVLGAVVLVMALLWPAMAVWNLVTGPAEGLCGPGGVPGWWPSILPLG